MERAKLPKHLQSKQAELNRAIFVREVDKAAELYEEIVKEAADFVMRAPVQYDLARLLEQAGNDGLAFQAYAALIERQREAPSRPPALKAAGMLAYKLEKFEACLEYLQLFLGTNPLRPERQEAEEILSRLPPEHRKKMHNQETGESVKLDEIPSSWALPESNEPISFDWKIERKSPSTLRKVEKKEPETISLDQSIDSRANPPMNPASVPGMVSPPHPAYPNQMPPVQQPPVQQPYGYGHQPPPGYQQVPPQQQYPPPQQFPMPQPQQPGYPPQQAMQPPVPAPAPPPYQVPQSRSVETRDAPPPMEQVDIVQRELPPIPPKPKKEPRKSLRKTFGVKKAPSINEQPTLDDSDRPKLAVDRANLPARGTESPEDRYERLRDQQFALLLPVGKRIHLDAVAEMVAKYESLDEKSAKKVVMRRKGILYDELLLDDLMRLQPLVAECQQSLSFVVVPRMIKPYEHYEILGAELREQGLKLTTDSGVRRIRWTDMKLLNCGQIIQDTVVSLIGSDPVKEYLFSSRTFNYHTFSPTGQMDFRAGISEFLETLSLHAPEMVKSHTVENLLNRRMVAPQPFASDKEFSFYTLWILYSHFGELVDAKELVRMSQISSNW